MQFAAALSTDDQFSTAFDQAASQALKQLAAGVDLALLFVSGHHAATLDDLAPQIAQRIGAKILLGCTGESIVGGAREIEDAPAVALWLAHLPGTHLAPLQLDFEQTPDGGMITGWPAELTGAIPHSSTLLLLGEPFTFPADLLLERLNEDQPRLQVLGGMASGGHGPGQNRLLLNDQALAEGAVGVWIDDSVRVTSVVSQGCRPIGRHFVVTKAQQNMIFELSGQSALECLHEVYGQLTPQEQQLVRGGLHLGTVVNEYQDSFNRGDFLIRNVTGIDRESGAVAIGDFVRVGQTVQFHVRDAHSADQDLRELTAAAQDQATPLGALLFTCNGRGTRLFEQPNHDAGVLAQQWNNLPTAGFFAQGEIGPVGGKNFLHGFTASAALFSPAK